MTTSHILAMAAVMIVVAAAASAASVSEPAPQTAATPAPVLVVQVCQGCHGPEIITQKGRSKDEWTAVVQTMVERGAMASDNDLQAIVDYLAMTYPLDRNVKVDGKAAGNCPAAPCLEI